MLEGLSDGNPFDPVLPVRILVPRNGVGSGQVVLTDRAGLKRVTARVGKLKGPAGANLPAEAVRVWYARQGLLHWCDELAGKPVEGDRTMPVWIEVQAPKDQAPGWYVGTLSLSASGRTFQVRVHVFVTAFVAPDPRDFRSTIVAMHSPEATARTYGLKPYSPEHFQVMGKSLALMASRSW